MFILCYFLMIVSIWLVLSSVICLLLVVVRVWLWFILVDCVIISEYFGVSYVFFQVIWEYKVVVIWCWWCLWFNQYEIESLLILQIVIVIFDVRN